jgi:hypothetical protein
MRVGFYEREITPPLGCSIPGYFETRISTGVKQKLYAKACVVEQDGVYAAFLALDCVSVPLGANEIVRQRVSHATPIAPESILIAAIHSHTAAPRVYAKPSECSPQGLMELDVIDHINRIAADAIILAYQRLQDACAYYAHNNVYGISFVRQYRLANGEIRTNPGMYIDEIVSRCGDSDPSLPIILFKDPQGNPLGSISSFALHHDTVGGVEYSSDYSGMLANNLKEQYGPNFVSLFYQGFCGDINHIDFCNKENPSHVTTQVISQALTEKWLEAAQRAEKLEDKLQVRWDTVLLNKREVDDDYLNSILELAKNPPVIHDIDISNPDSPAAKYIQSRRTIAWYIEDERKQIPVPVQVIALGDVLIFPFVGEPFSQFGHDLRAGSPSSRNMMVSLAHSGDFQCYYPTVEMDLPNVYESTYSACLFAPGSSSKIVNKSLEMANEMF